MIGCDQFDQWRQAIFFLDQLTIRLDLKISWNYHFFLTFHAWVTSGMIQRFFNLVYDDRVLQNFFALIGQLSKL